MPRTSKGDAQVAMESEVLTSRHAELDDFTAVVTLAVLGANMAAAGGQ